jgi:hypothetical protein
LGRHSRRLSQGTHYRPRWPIEHFDKSKRGLLQLDDALQAGPVDIIDAGDAAEARLSASREHVGSLRLQRSSFTASVSDICSLEESGDDAGSSGCLKDRHVAIRQFLRKTLLF